MLQTSSLGSPIWTKLGTQGNQWKSGQVNIPASTTNYNVAIEGVVGPGYRGDIGIDDIHMVPGACPNQGKNYFMFSQSFGHVNKV